MAAAERMASLVPDATVTIVEGAGHTVHLERPAVFEDVLRGRLTQPSSSPTVASAPNQRLQPAGAAEHRDQPGAVGAGAHGCDGRAGEHDGEQGEQDPRPPQRGDRHEHEGDAISAT